MKELGGKVAVVTGAASGIGLALAEAFLDEGMRVVMVDLNESALAEQAARFDDRVHPVTADVRDAAALDRAGEEVVEHFGALHVAVNNAGIVNGGNSWELSLDDWHRVIDVNLWGVIHGVRSFVPRILATGEEGHVVNTASMASVLPLARLGPYSVAKHGVLGLSDVLRAELEDVGAPVGVSVVMPGMVKTEMNPIGTIAAETVAANVVDAIRRDRPYVFTDQQGSRAVAARLEAIVASRADVLP